MTLICEGIDGYEGLYGVDLPRIERLGPLERSSAGVLEYVDATDLPYDVRQPDPRFLGVGVCVPVHGRLLFSGDCAGSEAA
jgi:hypothetical protein